MAKAPIEWTHEDEAALRTLAIDLFRQSGFQHWPTARKLAQAANLPTSTVCEIVESTHGFTPEGIGGISRDPNGRLPYDPDSTQIAIYDYEAVKDPTHPQYWDVIDKARPGDLEVTLRVLKAFGFEPNAAGSPVAVKERGRISWTISATGALVPGQPLSEGPNVLRFQAVLTIGKVARDHERLYLDTRDARDGAALAAALATELATDNPKPVFQSGPFGLRRDRYNPFRREPATGAVRNVRYDWEGVATEYGVYLSDPRTAYGDDYVRWRDDLVKAALGVRLRFPEAE